MKLKDFLSTYCDRTISIAITDSWHFGESTFDFRGVVYDILEDQEFYNLYGNKIVKSIDVDDDILYILVER